MVNRMHFNKIILCLLCMLFFSPTWAANITAKLDRNPVQLDESFHLIFEADSNVDEPDFSLLTNNFDILNSSQSTNMRSINGNWSLKKTWDLSLMSKQAGVFMIPSIPFGNELSPQLRITVKNSASPSAAKKPGDPGVNIYIEVDTDVKQAWLQSQIIYTIRLFSNIPVGRPTLSQPETDDPDTIFFKLGDVNNYEAFRQGERYAVSELKFAAFAQHSGELTFKPVLFEGLVADSRPRSLFDSFAQRGTVKRVRSAAVSVTIKPLPAQQDNAQWLPASQLTLVEEWSDDISQLKAGEPVTRTITLVAKGLTAEQLPTIKASETQGLKQYSDQPTLQNENSPGGVTGTRIMKTALIPSSSGEYRLPAVTVPWWNTRTAKAELATLPARVLQVSGVANILTNPLAAPNQKTDTASASSSATGTQQSVTPGAVATANTEFWRWLSLGLGSAWLLTSILLLLMLRGRPGQTNNSPASPRRLARAVQKHSRANQPGETRQALLAWAAARWPAEQIANLAVLAQHCNAELAAAIRALNAALYSASPVPWQGEELARAFRQQDNTAESGAASAESTLEPLYK